MEFKIKKGISFKFTSLNLDTISLQSSEVGIYPNDYPGLKLELVVSLGDTVLIGSPILTDNKIVVTSPISGIVSNIVIGARRKIVSIIISNDFKYLNANLKYSTFLDGLLVSGLFTSFKTRPFDKIARPHVLPSAIFVNATDSYPYSVPAAKVVSENISFFLKGIEVIKKFQIPIKLILDPSLKNIEGGIHFHGKHPYGLIGTHLNLTYPVSLERRIWYINYQDVVAIGKFFDGNYQYSRRIYALHGMGHHLIENDLGFNAHKLMPTSPNLISGSFLYGLPLDNNQPFIHRFHLSINSISNFEGPKIFGWLTPGLKKFTVSNLFLSSFIKIAPHLDTGLNGSTRALFPMDIY